MNRCALAHRLWQLTQRRAAARFDRALHHPQAAQEMLLRQTLENNQSTHVGRKLGFNRIRNLHDFARQVPLRSYEDLVPDLTRIRRGETHVLTAQPVTRLIPTSGTTTAAKLIPWTKGLQHQFNAGIAPWITDLFTRHPTLRAGPSYWSISPAINLPHVSTDAIPIGFDDDSAYLGRLARPLVDATLAVPNAVRHLHAIDDFHYATLWWLLQAPELRLVSVWHPSFWTLLMDALPQWWDRLVQDIAEGRCNLPSGTPVAWKRRPRRRHIQHPTPHPQMLWPRLTVISAWADAAAQTPFTQIQQRFPQATAQPKGVLSTEAFLSLPYQGQHPAAVTSHVIELQADDGTCVPLHAADLGGTYQAVVTTAGGLYRYPAGDRVHITGRLHQTPTLRLAGRTGPTSDLCGEKLHEHAVHEAIHTACTPQGLTPVFALLAPAHDHAPTHYDLFIAPAPTDADRFAADLDRHLARNPHYAHARRLGQLVAPQVHPAPPDADRRYLNRLRARGAALGNIKPASLSILSNWHSVMSQP